LVDPIIYNVPVALFERYRERQLIVRSHNPEELLEKLSGEGLERVAYVQLLSLDAEIDGLMRWEHPIPIDLAVLDQETDLPLLYRYSPLLDRRPIRVSVPVAPGFSRPAKLAVSLNFAVKLDVSQPGGALIEELMHFANYYLHQSTVSRPVEFFHSMFLAFYHNTPASLWDIQEENPLIMRYVTDHGEEVLSRRLSEGDYDIKSFPEEDKVTLTALRGACSGCEFIEYCAGYFKWPRRDYCCDGVKTIFRFLESTAGELRGDMASFHVTGVNQQ
jgi:hypothetical protein